MTFTFAQPLKLLTIGGSLITTTSLWFFNPHAPITPLAQTRSSSQSSARVSVTNDDDVNINRFDSAPKLTDLSGTIQEDDRIKDTNIDNNQKQITFQHEGQQIILMYNNFVEFKDLELKNIIGTRGQYKTFGKENIKIKLFKEHAFFSETTKDEFSEALPEDQVEDLLTGVDPTKAKQLLLSLQKFQEWSSLSAKGVSPSYYYGRVPHLSLVYSPEGLKDLRIKYFKDFSSLKTYVHKKVNESCTADDKACVADISELNFPKTDTLKYFSNNQ